MKNLSIQGVQLLLFPEYAGYEISSYENWQKDLPRYLSLFKDLSNTYDIYICCGTQVVETHDGVFNRAYLFTPDGDVFHQDKCVLTPYEKEEGILSPGNCIKLFHTNIGKIAICICYDVEFPLITQMLANQEVELILVPSYVSSMHGYYRVFNSCIARALEHQCFVAQSVLIGQTDLEIAYGSAAICSPIDEGFPEDGILSLGELNKVQAAIADVNISSLKKVRSNGQTKNLKDTFEIQKRNILFEYINLKSNKMN